MRKTASALLVSVVALAMVTACAKSNASAVDTIDENYQYPIDENMLSCDDLFIESLSDSVDYLVLPDDFVRTAEIDSLVALYNIAAATNALQSDIFLLTRDLAISEEMPKFDGSGVTDKTMLQLLTRLAAAMRSPYSEDNEEEYWDKVGECFGALNEALQDNYFNSIMSKIGGDAVNLAMSEYQYVADIESLQASVKTDSMIVQTLRQRLASEDQFIPRTVLAKQFALACYAHGDSINTPEVATGVIESLLRSGEYSPYLPELWRMWRCRIQIDALSPSNDGEIQNHLYNAMRNQVATTLLREYSQNHSADALDAFMHLATEYNIVRSGSFVGNSATNDDMTLFWSPTKQ